MSLAGSEVKNNKT